MTDLPAMIGRFHIKHCLMKDSSGQILIAWDVVNQAEVFIQTAPEGLKGMEEISVWFQSASNRAHSVQHPNLSKVLETLTDSEVGPYLVNERPAGVSLHGLVPRKVPFPAALHILIHASHGLIAAAGARVIPLQLFPEQIMVTPAGAVKVAVFGANYPVEQGQDTLCAVFARRAFELISAHFIDDPGPDGIDPSTLESGAGIALPPSVATVFQRAFARDKRMRFPSLRAFMDTLIAAAPLLEDQRLELLDLMDSDQPKGEDPIIAAVVPPEAQWEEVFPPKNLNPPPTPAGSATEVEAPTRHGSRRIMAITAAAGLVAALAVGGVVILRRPAPLTIQVDPPGAAIRVDGRMIGKAPFGPSREIKPGMVVQVESIGYTPSQHRVKEGDTLLNLKLDPIPPPLGEAKVPDAHETVEKPPSGSSPSSKIPVPRVKAKPKAPPAPKGKKGNVFDQLRTQM